MPFPFVLFLVLGGLSLAVSLLAPVHGLSRSRVALRFGLALALGLVWILIVADQLPCFLGVPNCD